MRSLPLWIATLLVPIVAGIAHAQAATGPERWETAIQAFEAEDRDSPPAADAVVFVGSSSIRFWRSLEEDFPSITPLNRGFGGSRISDVRYFADRLILAYSPQLVVLYAGDNDIAAGRSAQEVFEDYRAIATLVRQSLPDSRLVFIAIKPSPSRWAQAETMHQANAMVAEHAARDDKIDFVDVFTPMIGADGLPKPELYLADQLHLTEDGYRLWRDVVGPYLR